MKTALVLVVTLTSLASAADDASPSKDVETIVPKERSLHVRSFPGIFGYSSNLYEIPMHPYHFALMKCDSKNLNAKEMIPARFLRHSLAAIPTAEIDRANVQPLMALAVLSGGGGEAEGGGCSGEILFTQPNPRAPVLVTGNVTGLSAGLHGFHVHLKGDMREGCESAGPHFNPYLHRHGAPEDLVRHVGDLGNVKAGEDGLAKLEFLDPVIDLTGGPRGIVGRTLVVHAGQDDFGRGRDEESIKTGSSGAIICCGVIGYLN